MLREVYKSKPVQYETEEVYRKRGGGFLLGVKYKNAKAPYVEAHVRPLGLASVPSTKDPMPVGASAIYLLGRTSTNYWPTATQAVWVFDGKTGRFIRRLPAVLGLVADFLFWGPMFTSRLGVFYVRPPGSIGGTSGTITKITISTTAVFVTEDIIHPSHFEGLSGFGVCGIDDDLMKNDAMGGIFLNGTGINLGVYAWTSGEFKYTIAFPEQIVSICLADANQCYILLENRVIVLFDYRRGEVMGTAKVPPQESGADFYQNVALAWDPIYRRVLLTEETLDNPDSSSTTVVRGFQMVNDPVRLTRPIPLKVPRQRRMVPVLVQVLDELNQGVGVYAVEATVTGMGALVGIPVTDHRGDGLIQVAIVGHPLYAPWQPPTLPAGPDLGVPPIGKACWVGWIEFTPDLAYQPPGNSILNLAVDLELKDSGGDTVGTFIQKPTVEEIEEMVQDTVGPAIAYWAERTWPRYPTLRPGDWLCLHCFCKSYEPIPSFEINMRALIEAVPATNPICLVCQCSISGDNTQDLAGLVPVYARLARDYANVTMLLVSFDQGLPEGLASHPEVKPYWEDLYDGVPAEPAVMAAEAPVSKALSTVVSRGESRDTGSESGNQLPIGPVNVRARITILGPTITESDGLIIVGTPGAPGGGTDFNTHLPETAPNMKYVLDQVFESQEWKLKNSSGNNGRGAFVDRAVRAIHDIDAKFGYARNLVVGTGYKGHTDAHVVYKSADGITGEIIQIVEESGEGSVMWQFRSRDAAGLARWYFANVSGSGTDSASPGGSASNPIIAMSKDLDQITRDVTASWNHFNPLAMGASPPVIIGPIEDWVESCKDPVQLANGKWHQGWNRYWEDLMDINNPGFPETADPAHGTLPALYRA